MSAARINSAMKKETIIRVVQWYLKVQFDQAYLPQDIDSGTKKDATELTELFLDLLVGYQVSPEEKQP